MTTTARVFDGDPRRSRPRPAGRSASSPTCRGRSCGSAISPAARSSSQPASQFRLDLDTEPGDSTRAPLPHPEMFAALEPGTELLIDDGKVRLQGRRLRRRISPRPNAWSAARCPTTRASTCRTCVLPLSAVTEKDRADLAFALRTRRRLDRAVLRAAARRTSPRGASWSATRAGLMVKLEKPAAIRRLDEIIELADALMVARGDLGVEMPPEDVPTVQKQIIHACRLAGKPVIVATQMLESMITAPTPTRAEASDVATAVYEGADAVMLSAETAVGQYPIEAVAMMDRIARRVQDDPLYFPTLRSRPHARPSTPTPTRSAPPRARSRRTVGAAAIVSYTTSGATALRAARERPAVPILALTPNLGTARRLALLWGAHCVHSADVTSFADMVQKAVRTAHREEHRRARPARRHHRRRAVRHPRRHQHPAHRLGRAVARRC